MVILKCRSPPVAPTTNEGPGRETAVTKHEIRTPMRKQSQGTTRREFLQSLTVLGTAGVVTPIVLSACGGNSGDQPGATPTAGDFTCTDTSGLTEQEIQMRNNAEYVDDSPHPDQDCANCQLYEEPAEGEQCGGCQVIKGPIHPEGYCNLWVAQQA